MNRAMKVIRSLRGDYVLRVVLEGSRYVEGTDVPCGSCGDVSFDGHEVIGGRRFCCNCWHTEERITE